MIDHIDPINRLVYLDASTVNSEILPIDIYREMRAIRAADESLRPYDVFMTMKGGEWKTPDGSKRTERYLVLLNGTRIVPYDTSHTITVKGTIITDDGLEGIDAFDLSPLSTITSVNINYVPPQVEVIVINNGSTSSDGFTQADRDRLNQTATTTDVYAASILDMS